MSKDIQTAARARNFMIADATYQKLKIIAAEKGTTLNGAISFLINSYDPAANLAVKKFGEKE